VVDDVALTVRGNVQPGDIIIAIIRGGASTEAKSAAQVNDVLGKIEKGGSVTLQMKRGDQQFFTTLKALNGE
jgi:C-terminal processing protease CtpA/Prc